MKLEVLFLTSFLLIMRIWMRAQSLDTMAIDYTSRVYYTLSETTLFLCAPSNARHRPLTRPYREGLSGKPVKTIRMKRGENFGWVTNMGGGLRGMSYTFDVVGTEKQPVEMSGMFACAVGVNDKRGAIIDLETTNPVGWEHDVRPALASPADPVIYEIHHRDFSIDASSGLKHKGEHLALTESKVIEHLVLLGVNVVHTLPSYDYASVDETKLDQPQYNWGYDPLNYNVPEGSYATDPYKPEVYIREFKQVVQALHGAGIRVTLDVVCNHTFDVNGSNFQRTFPDCFCRKNAGGTYSDGSGYGNETASEKSLMREFMIESMKYWAMEYHIDGFRVGLMGVHDIETMNLTHEEMDKIDPLIYIYGEGWSAGTCAYPTEKLALKASVKQMPRIGAFSDELRDVLRGPFSDDSKGAFLAGIAGQGESIKLGIAGAIVHQQVDMTKVNYAKEAWATEPTQMTSYASCHNDMCLNDRLKASIPNLTVEEQIRLNLLGQTAIFTSQGMPFMLSGEETFRDKKRVHNSYKSPDSINRLDWDNLRRYPQVFSYYKELIALRRQYRAFHLGNAETVRQHLTFLPAKPCLVGYRLFDAPTNSYVYVLLNANKTEKQVSLPVGAYNVLCYDGVVDVNGTEKLILNEHADKAIVPAQSAMILVKQQ